MPYELLVTMHLLGFYFEKRRGFITVLDNESSAVMYTAASNTSLEVWLSSHLTKLTRVEKLIYSIRRGAVNKWNVYGLSIAT